MKRDGRYLLGPVAVAVIIFELITAAVWLSSFYLVERHVPAFQLARPWMLWALLGGPVLALIYLLDLGWKNRALSRFSQESTRPRMVPGVSSARSMFRFLLLRHGLSFIVVALAGPQLGMRIEEVKAKGVDVMVAVDVSNSMLAQDLKPSRMEIARRALSQLIERMRGDRLGIVVFAGDAYVQLPITADRSAAKLFLSSIEPNMVPFQGTAIGAAIELAQKSFGPDAAAGRSIIVISDGENHEDDAEGAARKAAEAGIVVNTIGLGTAEGAPIPARQGNPTAGFKKDKNGVTVISKLNEEMLRRIAAAGKGQYVRAVQQDTGIATLMASLQDMDQSELGTYRFAGHEDRYRLFLAIGCLMIFVALLSGERSGGKPRWITTLNEPGPSTALRT